MLEEMNVVVQSGLLSLTKKGIQLCVPRPPTLDACAGHRRPVVTSLLMEFWREEKEGRKVAYTAVEVEESGAERLPSHI